MDNSMDVKNVKPALGFWQIWNMCFGFFGIQFGWSLQMGNMSAIYEFLGAQPEEIPGLWLAAPMTGLIVQPIIGYLSDRTWHPKWGRRRPYFLIGAILSSIALFFMPNSPSVWIAAGTLWILDSWNPSEHLLLIISMINSVLSDMQCRACSLELLLS
jgi:maltose/moltooligosaccharide transporter